MAFRWLRWSIFSIGVNFFAKCWYFGCIFIMHAIKYVYIFIYVEVDVFFCIFGMILGLVSMFSLLSSCNELLVM